MSPTIDLALAEKGRGEPRQGLLDQGAVSVALAQSCAAALDAVDWAPARTQSLIDAVAALKSTRSDQVTHKDEAHTSVVASHTSVSYAKRFVRKLRLRAPQAISDNPNAGVTLADLAVHGKLGRSAAKYRDYLETIAPFVKKLDAALTKAFQGDAPSTVLAWVLAQLEASTTTEHTKLANLPEATLATYEAKGRLLQLIEALNNAGKDAYETNAVKAARFNKDVLLHARHEREHATAPTTPATPPAVAPPPPPAAGSVLTGMAAASSIVDASSSIVDASSSIVDAASSIIDATPSVVDATPSLVDAASSIVGATSSIDEATLPNGDACSSAPDPASFVVDSAPAARVLTPPSRAA